MSTEGTNPEVWRASAACQGADLATFYPYAVSDPASYDEARAICATCPVIAECAADMAGDTWGFWAGTSPVERAAAHSRRSQARPWMSADRALAASGMSDEEVAARTGRTLNAIRIRRSQLRRASWTLEEDAIATRDISAAQAAALLPGRTASAVSNRRQVLNYTPSSLARTPWTSEEVALLDTILTDDEIAARTGRTPNAVWKMRHHNARSPR